MRANKMFGYSNNVLIYFAISLYIFVIFTASAINLNVKNHAGQLTATITDINYPQSILKKELNSGLQNNISIFITFSQNDMNIFNCHLSFQITYDLWDENYVVIINRNSGVQVTRIINSSSEVLAFLNTIRVNCGDKSSKNETYILQAKVLVNPVKAKRIKKIKNWIATSKGYTAGSDKLGNTPINEEQPNNTNRNEGRNTGTMNFYSQASARPRFEKLFDKILQQYSGPNDIPSLWSSEVATLLVDLETLKDEN
ncbi:MAG: hypothetical protein ACI9LM_004098 [Alteromonadaceae bacterium]|jgi:hypothetical protein